MNIPSVFLPVLWLVTAMQTESPKHLRAPVFYLKTESATHKNRLQLPWLNGLNGSMRNTERTTETASTWA